MRSSGHIIATILGAALVVTLPPANAQRDPCSGGCRCYGPNCGSGSGGSSTVDPSPRYPRTNPTRRRATRLNHTGLAIFKRAKRSRRSLLYKARLYRSAAGYFRAAYRLWRHPTILKSYHNAMASHYLHMGHRALRRNDCESAAGHFLNAQRWGRYSTARARARDRADLNEAMRCWRRQQRMTRKYRYRSHCRRAPGKIVCHDCCHYDWLRKVCITQRKRTCTAGGGVRN